MCVVLWKKYGIFAKYFIVKVTNKVALISWTSSITKQGLRPVAIVITEKFEVKKECVCGLSKITHLISKLCCEGIDLKAVFT